MAATFAGFKTAIWLGKEIYSASQTGIKNVRSLISQNKTLNGKNSANSIIANAWSQVRGILTNTGECQGFLNSIKFDLYTIYVAPEQFRSTALRSWISAEVNQEHFLTLLRHRLGAPKPTDDHLHAHQRLIEDHQTRKVSRSAKATESHINAVLGLAQFYIEKQLSPGENYLVELIESKLEMMHNTLLKLTGKDKFDSKDLKRRDAILSNLARVRAEDIRRDRPLIYEGLSDDFPVGILKAENSKRPIPRVIFTADERDFESLLGRYKIHRCSTEEYLESLAQGGVRLCQAPGGQGKSFALAQLTSIALTQNWVVVIIDLGLNRHQLQRSLTDEGAEVNEAALFAPLKVGSLKFDDAYFDNEAHYLFLIDGLNEISSDTARACVLRFNKWTTGRANVNVVIMDRMTDRDFGENEIAEYLSLCPLSKEVILQQFDDEKTREFIRNKEDLLRLFSRPIFLGWAREAAHAMDGIIDFHGRADILEYFLVTIVNQILPERISNKEFKNDQGSKNYRRFEAIAGEISKAAELMYRKGSHKSFEATEWNTGSEGVMVEEKEFGWGTITSALLDANVLIRDNENKFYFQHQLIHDYLVARAMAARPKGNDVEIGRFWSYSYLWSVTWEEENLDPINLGAERLGRIERPSDDFVLEVYDFHWPVALQCAQTLYNSRNPSTGYQGISNFLGLALSAVIACRVAEVFAYGPRGAATHVRNFDDGPAARVTKLVNRAVKRLNINGAVSKNDLRNWLKKLNNLVKTNFTNANSNEMTETLRIFWADIFDLMRLPRPIDVKLILDDNSLLGWTAVNVARLQLLYNDIPEAERSALSEICCDEHDGLCSPNLETKDSTDWSRMIKRRRLLYLLGVAGNSDAEERLSQVCFGNEFANEHAQPRLDAFRSLVETAALYRNQRSSIFGIIKYNLQHEFKYYRRYWRTLRGYIYRVQPFLVEDFGGWCNGMIDVLKTGLRMDKSTASGGHAQEWEIAIQNLREDLEAHDRI